MASYVAAYRASLVREGSVKMEERPTLRAPEDVARLFLVAIPDDGVEHFSVAMLDARHRVTAYCEIAKGSLTGCFIVPREVFVPALLHKAAAIVVSHSHPSGDESPSDEDLALTKRLVSCGALLGVEVLDHVIVGCGSHRWMSFHQRGLL